MFALVSNKSRYQPVLALVILVSLSLFMQGCIGLRTVRGSGEMASEQREVSDFKAVAFSGVGTILIELGEDESLRVEGEDNLLQYVETEVSDDTLHIGIRDGVNILPTQSMFFYLTVQEIDELALSGLGNVDAPDLEVGRFSVDISGGGDINLAGLEADELDVSISGLGDLHIDDGAVTEQTISISGGGNYNARYMASDVANLDISGLGSATVWAMEQLDVEISGGGSVRYVGDPTVNEDVSGVGRVERVGE